jgi:hypothetical protein
MSLLRRGQLALMGGARIASRSNSVQR